MIRHARLRPPVPIGSLSKEVSLSAWLRPLIAAVGRAPLLPPRFLPARLATVALSTVAMAAHPKEGATARGTTEPRAEGSFGYGQHRLDFRICHNTPDAEMIGQMTCACGADDVALFPRPEFKKGRFQMIDDMCRVARDGKDEKTAPTEAIGSMLDGGREGNMKTLVDRASI